MPKVLDEPLYQTSIKLFDSDVEWLQKTYGPGWTSVVRDIVRKDVTAQRTPMIGKPVEIEQ